MKISLHTMYFLPDFGSAPILMDELAEDLARRGHEVEVVTTFPRAGRPEFRGLAFSRRPRKGFVVKRFWTNRTPHPLGRLLAWNLYTAGALLNLALARRPDVVFLRTPPLQLGLPGLWAKLLRGARVLVNVQDIHPDLAIESGILRNPAGIRFARGLERSVYALADRIAVISDGFRRNLLAKGVPDRKITVIPNWVDTGFLRPLPKDNPVSRRLGLDGKFVVLYSGTVSISSNRALERVLEAAALLAGDPDLLFVISGDGLMKEALRARADGLGLRNVAFIPFQPYDDLPNLLASADILLVPLDSDKSRLSVPSKLYASMAAGRSVLGLAPADSDVAVLLRGRACGMSVPPDDPDGIARAVRDLRREPEARRAFALNARAHVVEHFARENVLRTYGELLEDLASRPSGLVR